MRRYSGYMVLLASGLLLGAGCGRTNNTAQNTTPNEASREAPSPKTNAPAMVRFVSSVNAHPNTDLYFGDRRLFSTTGAEKPTGYMPVPAERRDFSLRQAGQPNGMEIEKKGEGLKAGNHYTVVAFEDKDSKPVLKVFDDDESAPAAGKAKVRLIHAAPAVEALGLYAAGHKDKLAGESRFSSASTWQEVDPVTGPLEIRTGNGKNASTASVALDGIEPGKMYTLIVQGGPKSGEPLHVTTLVDNPMTPETSGRTY